jgi:dTMP kinase
MQLLYVANRYELRDKIATALDEGVIVLCDRYVASSVAYGEAQGVDAEWLVAIQRRLPQPDVTVLLDIPPEVSARRKRSGRDAFERDLELLARVRQSYIRQAAANFGSWVRIDADRDRDAVAADVYAAVEPIVSRG